MNAVDGSTYTLLPTWELADEFAAQYPELPAAQICWVVDRAYLAASALGTPNARTIREFAGDRLDAARARNVSAKRSASPRRPWREPLSI